MCWRGHPRETATGDGYEWICNYLDSCDGDLLEFELDDDGQHFYDNLDLLPPYTPQPNELCGEFFQLTPFVRSVVSKHTSIAKDTTSSAYLASPISYCALLEDAQSTAMTTRPSDMLETRGVFHAVTTPRKSRARDRHVRDKKAATVEGRSLTGNPMSSPTRSSSRKLNRRLFY
ncbi:unnamed protein product [Hyaloperonospora brassicae]|uniref:Uncharacterized protein n=1 Tax=Hyaloperonospora brassicae TaxID=162125 RepID=A0AAV0TEJ8_HYABA|nr:unnamed protein product [Hyaloperonospora brassicae]